MGLEGGGLNRDPVPTLSLCCECSFCLVSLYPVTPSVPSLFSRVWIEGGAPLTVWSNRLLLVLTKITVGASPPRDCSESVDPGMQVFW